MKFFAIISKYLRPTLNTSNKTSIMANLFYKLKYILKFEDILHYKNYKKLKLYFINSKPTFGVNKQKISLKKVTIENLDNINKNIELLCETI